MASKQRAGIIFSVSFLSSSSSGGGRRRPTASCRRSGYGGSSRRTRPGWAASTGPADPSSSASSPGTTPPTATWRSTRVLLSTSSTRSVPDHHLWSKLTRRIPRGQEKFLAIIDLQGWGYANCDVRAYIASIEIMQNYYPERLGKALMINVPYIFMKVWKTMIYPFIDANTRDKFVFVEDKNLHETLRQEIDESQLPEYLGGKMPLIALKDYVVQPESA
ncbi:unnamed protein product [Urochloa humidicola]